MLLPELDRSKEMLKVRKDYMRPVKYKDLLKHERKYIEDLQEKTRRLKELRKSQSVSKDVDLSKYKSKLIEKIRERDAEIQLREKQKVEEKYKVKERMETYAKVAMDVHRPKVSEAKKEELKAIIEKLSKKVKPERQRIFEEKIKLKLGTPQVDKQYLTEPPEKKPARRKQRNQKIVKSNKSNQHSSKNMSVLNTPHPYTSKIQDDWNTKLRMKREERSNGKGLSESQRVE